MQTRKDLILERETIGGDMYHNTFIIKKIKLMGLCAHQNPLKVGPSWQLPWTKTPSLIFFNEVWNHVWRFKKKKKKVHMDNSYSGKKQGRVLKWHKAREMIRQLWAGEPGAIQPRDGIKVRTSDFSWQLLAAMQTQMTAGRLQDFYPH